MLLSLSRQTAQKIVDAVKEVCGYDINFINNRGIIFASTDESRIGNFHEIGKKAIDMGETIEVESDDLFMGTHKGVNIPYRYNKEIIAVIGISGKPDEVRKYALLAQRITSLILKEHEIDSLNYNRKSWLNYITRSLIEGREFEYNELQPYFNELKLNINWNYRTVVVRINIKDNISNISSVENDIYRTFEKISARLFTFQFPNEYVALLPEHQYVNCSDALEGLASEYKNIISMGVGNSLSIWHQFESYQCAEIAIESLEDGENYSVFDKLDLEIILGCINENVKNEYISKTISKLDREDRKILKIYFDNNLSLKDTSDKLFIHKNTLQYKLNKIKNITGYDPRVFKDALKLYMAIRLE